MRKFKGRERHTLPFGLLVIVAGALMLMAAFAPRANADVIAYWNFEDGAGENLPVNLVSDAPGLPGYVIVPFGVNPYTFPDMRNSAPGFNVGLAPGDPGPSTLGMGLSGSGGHSPTEFRFSLPTASGFFQDMTMSLAMNRLGNGFTVLAIAYSTTGINGAFTTFGSTVLPDGPTVLLTAAVPSAANNAPNLAFSIIVTGGQSNGNNVQNTIDNILIVGTIVPEPTTVAGGLLGILGLCWFQRQRLRLLLPRLRRA